ncbi:MAG: Na/Pi cotransporter family protein [Ruminococcaceae bacterium]|nr:Na/Pi cotransporter family protein [Oscillospiraceae bacterium]
MDIFDALSLVGGLCLFLFGMNVMGQSLERRAGSHLRNVLSRLTTGRVTGFLTGLGVTAVIQSSSATTVMVVGFVNSGLMNLRQAINVIMGANVGTTVTAWILSLGSIGGESFILQMLKPTSFTPILALIGICYYMFGKRSKSKDTGMILLGFATLMFGMDAMSDAVADLRHSEAFGNLFVLFENPLLGMLVGAVLTAIIQSSSASVGILQALSVTGKVSYGAAIPIIMGQNIGTCVTAVISCVGARKDAKRAAVVHLLFNVIGTAVWLTVFSLVSYIASPEILGESASSLGIAILHTVFKLLCLALLMPMSNLLEKLVVRLVPDKSDEKKPVAQLDERLLATPPLALENCHAMAVEMAQCAVAALKNGIRSLTDYSPELAQEIRDAEERSDHYEDVLGSYLVKLSACQISDDDSREAAVLLKVIGDFERISDHSVNLLESAEELREKGFAFSAPAQKELAVLCRATNHILDLSLEAFLQNDPSLAAQIEPLEQVIDKLKENMRTSHILRLQQGNCTVETGFVWSDLLTNLERTSDHCSNIAGSILDMAQHNMNIHASLRALHTDNEVYRDAYERYRQEYSLV